MPATITAGTGLLIQYCLQAGGSPAASDIVMRVIEGVWDGSTIVTESKVVATGLNDITMSVDGVSLTLPEAIRLVTRHADSDWIINGDQLTHEDADGVVASYTFDSAAFPKSRTKN
jgi:hypothetical protein